MPTVVFVLEQLVVVDAAPVMVITPEEPAEPPVQVPEIVSPLPDVICGVACVITIVGPTVLRCHVPERVDVFPAWSVSVST